MASPHEEPFQRITPQEAQDLAGRGATFIDVREPDEYLDAHAQGTRLMPLNTIFTDPSQLPDDGDIVFICKAGKRSAMAAEMAAASKRAKGTLYSVDGGTDAWLEAGLPRE